MISKKILSLFLILNFAVSLKAKASQLIPPNDVTYLGAFIIPQASGSCTIDGSTVTTSFNNTMGSIAYNPNGNGGLGSLIVKGQFAGHCVSEISIPSPKIDTLTNLNTAVRLQPFVDITGGLHSTGSYYQDTTGFTLLPAYGSQTQDKLYWDTYYDYMPPTTDLTMGWTDVANHYDFTTNVQTHGKYGLSGFFPADFGKLMFNVDKTWADTYVGGRYLGLMGDRTKNTTNGMGYGPSLFVTNPWSQYSSDTPPLAGTLFNATQLLGYTVDNRVTKNWSNVERVQGLAWVNIGGKSALITDQEIGMRSATYTTSANNPTVGNPIPTPYGPGDYPLQDYKYASCSYFCFPEEETSYGLYANTSVSDMRAEPYLATLHFYDTDDLAAVAQGSKKVGDIHPYASMQLENYWYRTQGDNLVGGMTYDPTNQILYVMESNTTSGAVIHVFKISDSGVNTLNVAPPTQPTNVQSSNGIVTWSPSTDNTGKTVYMIFKHWPLWINKFFYLIPEMWRPVVETTATSWTDPHPNVTTSVEVARADFSSTTESDLSGNYFTINSPAQNYYVWFYAGSSVDPVLSGLVGIQVSISSADTSSVIASKVATAISANTNFFSVSDGNVATIRVKTTGASISATSGNISSLSVNAYPTSGQNYAVVAYNAIMQPSNYMSTTKQTYNAADFVLLVSNWLHRVNNLSDINLDNIINVKDLGIMMSKWN